MPKKGSGNWFSKQAKKVEHAIDTKVTTFRKTPNPKQNFFQNYSDHLDALDIKHTKEVKKNLPRDPHLSEVAFYSFARLLESDNILDHLLIFDALRDGHDYMDEVVGATVVPLVGALTSVAAAGLAIWEGAQALAIKAGFKKNDYENHGAIALTYLAAAGAALAVAAGSLIKSLISLVTRPIATLIQGWKEQDKDRFYNEKSIGAQVTDEPNEMLLDLAVRSTFN